MSNVQNVGLFHAVNVSVVDSARSVSPFVVSLSNHERLSFDILRANGLDNQSLKHCRNKKFIEEVCFENISNNIHDDAYPPRDFSGERVCHSKKPGRRLS